MATNMDPNAPELELEPEAPVVPDAEPEVEVEPEGEVAVDPNAPQEVAPEVEVEPEAEVEDVAAPLPDQLLSARSRTDAAMDSLAGGEAGVASATDRVTNLEADLVSARELRKGAQRQSQANYEELHAALDETIDVANRIKGEYPIPT